MEASWAEPCWVYDEALLEYHLRRPSVDRDLLLGLEDEATGELVAYYAFMPLPLLVEEKPAGGLRELSHRRGDGADAPERPGPFRSGSSRKRWPGATRTIWPSARWEPSRTHSIGRSCEAVGLTTRTVATIPYLATAGCVVPRRARPASGSIPCLSSRATPRRRGTT